MKRKILLKNGNVVGLEPLKIEVVDLLVQEGRVVERRQGIRADAETEILDCRGRFILPGFVDAHAELHLSQSLGLPPGSLGEVEGDPLQRDRRIRAAVEGAHTPETLVTAAFAGALEAVRNGTTAVIDLHHAPGASADSLALVRDVLLTVGLRAVVSFRSEPGDDGLEGNAAFAQENRSDTIAGLVSLTAERVLDAESLRTAAARVAEDGARLLVALESADSTNRAVSALEAAGLLGPQTLVTRAVGLDEAAREKLVATGTWLIHCPSVDAREGLPQLELPSLGEMVSLGSGSSRSDVLGEARLAFYRARGQGLRVSAEDVLRLVVGGQQLASELLQVELGSTRRDAGADFTIFKYHPRTPIRTDNLADHILFGLGVQHVETVMIDGALVYRDGRFPDVDTRHLAPLMRRGARQLWEALGSGTA
ncbi:MAG: amidohydrolase family protein [Planctomycetota bacterium]